MMHRRAMCFPCLCVLAACGASPSTAPSPVPVTTVSTPAASTTRLRAEVWADNWFAFHVGEAKVAEDSVPITVERSFNAETFTFDATYPLTLNFVVRDYIQAGGT